MGAHPQHDLITQEVRGWYTDWRGRAPGPAGSDPGVEVRFHHASFGYLRDAQAAGGRRIVLTIDDPQRVPAALASAEDFFGTRQFDVWLDDRERSATLESALASHGLHASDNTVVLALIGPLRAREGPDALEVSEVVNDEQLETWARVKLLAFADKEQEPSGDALDRELSARRAEWPIARYELAALEGEPVAVLAHYTSSVDQMVFNLATRVAFRQRGVAQSMLRRWTERATVDGARSLLINCDEHGRPAGLYRQMGFTDEVYWHRRFQRSDT